MKTFKTLVSVFALSALFATSSCTQQQNQKEMDNHSNVFMYENDMEWEPAGEGVTRQIVGYNEKHHDGQGKIRKRRCRYSPYP